MFELYEGDFLWCRACWEIVRTEFKNKSFCGAHNLVVKNCETGEVVLRGEFNDKGFSHSIK